MSKPKDKNDNQAGQEESIPTASFGDSSLSPGAHIGPYKLLSILGEGGFAVVYLAEQERPVKRRVALKIIKPGMDSKQVIARFEAERQALALLDHPNVAHVYNAGTTPLGRPYFVMEYVKGVPITEHCDRHNMTVEERLKLFLQVCEAVQHAHQKGIIHRDLKPSNILVLFEGQHTLVKVIDFGIAKAISQPLTDRTLYTEQGQLVGTPEYMSPEQAEMTTQDIDTRSDIYSLGVVLYELLAGVLPFEAQELRKGGIEHIRTVIREQEPGTPSVRLSRLTHEQTTTLAQHRRIEPGALKRELRGDLDWITLKAMDKDRTRRYGSAGELAADIQRHLNHEPVVASPPSTVYRLKKFIRRNRAVVTGIAAVLVVLLAGIVVAWIFAIQAERQAEVYRRSLYVRNINRLDSYYYSDGNISLMRDLLKDCPEDLRGWEWYYLRRVSDESIMTLRGHEDAVNLIAFSPVGRRIVSCSWDNTIKVWDAETGDELRTLEEHEAVVTSVAFNHDGSQIVSGSADANCIVWDAETGNKLFTLEGHTGQVNSVAFNHDGSRIVSGSEDMTVRVWDTESGIGLLTLEEHTAVVRSVAFSPDGSQIFSGSSSLIFLGSTDYSIIVWDAITGEPIRPLEGQFRSPVFSSTFSSDVSRIVTGGNDGSISVWDTESLQEVFTIENAHEILVNFVDFSSDGSRIVSCSWDNTIKIWDAETRDELRTLQGHEGSVSSVTFSPDGSRIVSAGQDGTIRIWDTEIGSKLMTLRGHEGPVNSIAFSPDGRMIVSGSWDGTIRIHDAVTGELMRPPLEGHDFAALSVAFSPDSRKIVSGGVDGTIKIWDAVTGELIRPPLEGHEDPVWSVAFSPDGRRIALGGHYTDPTIKVWNAESGDELFTLVFPGGLGGNIFSVAFSPDPDGKWIVSGSGDRTIRIWDAESGKELMPPLEGHKTRVRSVAFNSDGSRIVSGSDSGVIKVWDIESGSELINLRGHDGAIVSVFFSPGDNSIVSGSADATIKVWNIPSREEVEAEMLAEKEGRSWIRSD